MYPVAVSRASAAFRPIRHVSACLLAGFVFLVGCSSKTTNPPTVTPSADASVALVSSYLQVDQVLEHSCFDCHSDQKSASWNARLAPSYLFGASKARQALDFSAWPDYNASRKRAEMAAITQVIEDDSMPPGDYALLHPSAGLSDQQRRQVLQWAAPKLPPVAP